jgi:CTP synthase
MPKYIFVTGGVMSGLGKGVSTASIAKLLQLSGLRITCLKIDPYLNFDAGTMNPIIHGEVFVTDDGGETDMDLGTYERFLNQNLTKENNVTTGQVYRKVIDDERKGRFLGKCVQIIPHVTEEIKKRIRSLANNSGASILIVECGGTVGDIEGLPFLEAFRQMRLEEGAMNTLFVHVTLAPEIAPVGEMKTKPTQHSVQEMRRIGIQPDLLIVRGSKPIPKSAKEKIALFASVPTTCVISNPDVESIYLVPETLHNEGILKRVQGQLKLQKTKTKIGEWSRTASRFVNYERTITVAMVGKYASLADSYVSVNEAMAHAAAISGASPQINWIEAEDIEKQKARLKLLDAYDGIIIPQGFGSRGSDGKIETANYARVAGIPFLGLCYGFQLATVSFARYVLGLKEANSTEIDPGTPDPVIDLLPEQKSIAELGGTMRLGGHDVHIRKPSKAFDLYGKQVIRERHRHRYELNQKYLKDLEGNGLRFSAFSDDSRRAEILEIDDHPFFMATQYHPEYVSRPENPEPAYIGFVRACVARSQRKQKEALRITA